MRGRASYRQSYRRLARPRHQCGHPAIRSSARLPTATRGSRAARRSLTKSWIARASVAPTRPIIGRCSPPSQVGLPRRVLAIGREALVPADHAERAVRGERGVHERNLRARAQRPRATLRLSALSKQSTARSAVREQLRGVRRREPDADAPRPSRRRSSRAGGAPPPPCSCRPTASRTTARRGSSTRRDRSRRGAARRRGCGRYSTAVEPSAPTPQMTMRMVTPRPNGTFGRR